MPLDLLMRQVEEEAPAAAGNRVVEVWEIHMRALEVYQRCMQSVAAGGMAVVWLGISAQEVRAALAVSGTPRAAWAEVADDVQAMGLASAEWRNRQAEQAAKSRARR